MLIGEAAADYARAKARSSTQESLTPVHTGDAGQLWEAVSRHIGGKLIRPRLVATAYLGLGGADLRALIPVAAAHELLHTAMLIHDDLIDHDDTRRGEPTIASRYRAGNIPGADAASADAAAILGGDLAMWGAVELVLDAGLDPAVHTEVMRLLVRAVHTTVAGEILDVLGQYRAPGEVDAQAVAQLKTAVYSVVVPLVTGARMAGASDALCDRLERFGSLAGVAFQLVDDLLGTFGSADLTGKSALSDLREGKRTELVAVASRRADAEQLAVIERHLGDPDLDEQGAEQVRAVLRETGAVTTVRETARALGARAVEELGAEVPDPLRIELVALADTLVERLR